MNDSQWLYCIYWPPDSRAQNSYSFLNKTKKKWDTVQDTNPQAEADYLTWQTCRFSVNKFEVHVQCPGEKLMHGVMQLAIIVQASKKWGLTINEFGLTPTWTITVREVMRRIGVLSIPHSLLKSRFSPCFSKCTKGRARSEDFSSAANKKRVEN